MSIADKLTTIAENMQRVYDAGKAAGGDAAGYAAGQKAEYDRFWDAYQANGTQTSCDSYFAGRGWTSDIFKPKHDIKPTRAQAMFSLTGIRGDLVELCESAGVTIDFSNCTLFSNFASNAFYITRFGVIDISKATDQITFINSSELVTIDGLIYSENTPVSSSIFFGCGKLANVTFSGTIAKSGLNISHATALTHDSLLSCLNCLKDYSATGGTYTITIGSTNLAKLTDAEKAIATDKGWTLA